MRDLNFNEIDGVSGGNPLVEIAKEVAKAVVVEVIIEGGKKLIDAMNDHAETCGQVIHDDPSSRGRALL